MDVNDKLSMSLADIAKEKRNESKAEAAEKKKSKTASAGPAGGQRKAGGSGPVRRQVRGQARREQQSPFAGGAGRRLGSGGRPAPRAITCRTCGGLGHMSRDCPSARGPSGMGGVRGGCYACGGDHQKRDCPHLDKRCDNCLEIGHLKATCKKPLCCYACGSTAHNRRDCPHTDKICDNCYERGHLAARCFKSMNNNNTNRSNRNGGGAPRANLLFGASSTAAKCDNCGNPGHLKRDCPEDKRCFRCGSLNHVSRDCGAKDKTCELCLKVGHLKAMCRQRN